MVSLAPSRSLRVHYDYYPGTSTSTAWVLLVIMEYTKTGDILLGQTLLSKRTSSHTLPLPPIKTLCDDHHCTITYPSVK